MSERIDKKLDNLIEISQRQDIKLARIDEHLKSINGAITRHENKIRDLETKHEAMETVFSKCRAEELEFRGSVNARLAIATFAISGFVSLVFFIFSKNLF